jgi:hypothetical protein
LNFEEDEVHEGNGDMKWVKVLAKSANHDRGVLRKLIEGAVSDRATNRRRLSLRNREVHTGAAAPREQSGEGADAEVVGGHRNDRFFRIPVHATAALLVACLALAVTGCSSGDVASSPPSSPAESTSADRPTVTLDGTYLVEWDGTGTRNGAPADDMRNEKNGWAFRTTCNERGCLATGGSIADPSNPSAPLANVRVADYVDGRWLMTVFGDGAMSCDGPGGAKHSGDGWTIWDIVVAPDGSLTPTVTVVGTDDCASIEVYTPRMTKLDDSLSGVPVPDPIDQPALVRSNAAAFHGEYTLTLTPRAQPGLREATNHRVATFCLRSGDRCITTSIDEASPVPAVPIKDFTVLQFADDAFTNTSRAATQPCDGGDVGQAQTSEILPLPQAAATPLPQLIGERTVQGCADTAVTDIEYVLVGA